MAEDCQLPPLAVSAVAVSDTGQGEFLTSITIMVGVRKLKALILSLLQIEEQKAA